MFAFLLCLLIYGNVFCKVCFDASAQLNQAIHLFLIVSTILREAKTLKHSTSCLFQIKNFSYGNGRGGK